MENRTEIHMLLEYGTVQGTSHPRQEGLGDLGGSYRVWQWPDFQDFPKIPGRLSAALVLMGRGGKC